MATKRLRLTVFGVIAMAGLVLGAMYLLGWPGTLKESGPSLSPDDPAVVARGKEIYGDQCAVCHGAALEGQPDWQTRKADGRLPAPPHNEEGHTWHHADAILFALTKFGPQSAAGPDYQSDMPAYHEILSDADILAVLSFIKSRWPEQVQRRHDAINEAYETVHRQQE